MTNPFEDENGEFLVLVNDELQYSLWPAAIAVPKGWTVAKSRTTRDECVRWVEEHWTDMRPKSLVDRMNANE